MTSSVGYPEHDAPLQSQYPWTAVKIANVQKTAPATRRIATSGNQWPAALPMATANNAPTQRPSVAPESTCQRCSGNRAANAAVPICVASPHSATNTSQKLVVRTRDEQAGCPERQQPSW